MKKLVLAAVAVLATTAVAQATTVFSDDFELNDLGLSTPVNGWTVASGSVDVIGTDYFQWYGAGRYLDMNGSTGTPGRIERVISGLTAGVEYLLSFDVGFNNYSGNSETLSYGIDGLLGSVDVATSGATASTFAHYVLSFVATGSSATLFFADTGATPGDNGGPVLDNVSVDVSPVPVPAAGVMLLAGLGGLAGLRRRKTA